MALEKDYDYKGKIANYWKIVRTVTDYITGKTMVEVRLYWDKAARDSDVNNYLEHREVKNVYGIDLSTSQCYTKFKESEINKNQEEMNWFADAKDVLEAGQVKE